MTLDEARKIAARPHKQPTATLEKVVDVLSTLGNDESDQHLTDDVQDELDRRDDVEPHDDTPSLQDRGIDLPTYGA